MKYKDLRSIDQADAKLREKKLTSKKVFDGKLLHVYSDMAELPDQTTSIREWIKHPGASAVVPVFEDGTIMLLQQFRYPPKKTFIEVPAGKIDPGEDKESTAERELFEESGIKCEHMEKVGSFYPAIGYADEIIYVYAAWGLTEEAQAVDDDEFLLKYRIPFSKALKMIKTGEITDGKTICSLIQTSMWWIENAPFEVDLG
jgi:ADP-ribose pyrophosphatase